MIAWLILSLSGGALAAEPLPWTEEARAVTPADAEVVWSRGPGRARNGTPRFVGSMGADQAAVIMERLAAGGDASDVRVALVRWVQRSGHEEASAWIAHWYGHEADPAVRAALVYALKRAADPVVVPVVRTALQDPAPAVRIAAASTAAYAGSDELVDALTVSTRDADPQVAGLSARTLGVLGAVGAFDAVSKLTGASDPEVRLRALRSLQRLDPERAALLSQVRSLLADPDPRVSRAASQISGR